MNSSESQLYMLFVFGVRTQKRQFVRSVEKVYRFQFIELWFLVLPGTPGKNRNQINQMSLNTFVTTFPKHAEYSTTINRKNHRQKVSKAVKTVEESVINCSGYT